MENCDCRDHLILQVKPVYEAIVNSIKNEMDKVTSSGCICEVVKEGIDSNENTEMFVPQKISIGPLHHDKPKLKEMENHKLRYLYALLSRKPNLEANMDTCVHALKELEQRARLCYDKKEKLDKMLSDEFVKLMLVDGGFIIELFIKYSVKGLKPGNDYIFSTPGLLFDLRNDMILLENQIPFFILQRLFEIVPIPKQCSQSLPDLAFRFFRSMIPGDDKLHREKFSQEGNHLLDLIRHCFLPTIPRIQPKQPLPVLPKTTRDLPSVRELKQKQGVRFKKSRTENLLDIKFVKGVLEIPPILVHHYTEMLFMNLIAYEKCNNNNTRHIISYVLLMTSLIRSIKDAKSLRRRGILTTYDGHDDHVQENYVCYKLFENLRGHVSGDDLKGFESYFEGICEQVNGYKATNWRVLSKTQEGKHQKQKARRFPSTTMSVVGISLLVLIFVGTLFSVLSFFLHH